MFLTEDFFLSKHDSADGGIQAIRIKRFTEKMFLPARKLCGVGATKGKVSSYVMLLIQQLHRSCV